MWGAGVGCVSLELVAVDREERVGRESDVGDEDASLGLLVGWWVGVDGGSEGGAEMGQW